jgi:hypothetical protein
MDTALEFVLNEFTKATASSQHLCFDDIFHGPLLSELLGNQEGLFAIVCGVSEGDGDAVLLEESSSLVLVEL